MAHPLGANFSETIGILRYQPAPKWTLLAKAMYWKQGLDTAAAVLEAIYFYLIQLRRGRVIMGM
jgi:hypothetical protein